MTAVAVVSPGYPDAPGGVTDHTRRLVASWTARGHRVTVLASNQTRPAAAVAQWHAVGVQAILLQYVPFLYGRFGISPFPRQIVRHARVRGIRTVVFVHEPWVPPTRPRWWILSPLQRRQLRAVLRLADGAVTSVPAWSALLGRDVTLIYVGATLDADPQRLTPGRATPSAPVVFSPFAAGLEWSWIAAAARAIAATPHLVVVGAAANDGRVPPDVTCDWRGHLDAPGVMDVLGGARLVLAPFIDGLTGRRTSALAALRAGAPLVSSRGHLYDPVFDAGPASIAHTRDEFIALARARWAADPDDGRAERLAWYRAHFDPTALDDRLLAVVRGTAA